MSYRKISFTKAERQAVWDAYVEDRDAFLGTLVGKMDAAMAPLPAREKGLSADFFLGALKAAGCEIALPPKPTDGWWAKMARVLR